MFTVPLSAAQSRCPVPPAAHRSLFASLLAKTLAVLMALALAACGGGGSGGGSGDGSSSGSTAVAAPKRFDYPSALDTSFAQGGLASIGNGLSQFVFVNNFTPLGVTVDAQDRIVTVGRRTSSAGEDTWILRTDPNGRVDTSCGIAGWGTHSGQSPALPRRIKTMPDGRYAIAGLIPFSSIVMFKPDCTKDTGYGNAGIGTLPLFNSAPIVDFTIGADGSITALVDTMTDGFRLGVGRLLPNGQPDPSFGNGVGAVRLTEPNNGAILAGGLKVRPDGRILVAASFDYSLQVGIWAAFVQLTPDGRLDPQFGTGGIYATKIGSNMAARAGDLVLLPDGSAIQGGNTTSTLFSDLLIGADSYYLKVDARGQPVNAFGTGGQIIWSAGPAGSRSGNFLMRMVLAPDGSLLECQNWTNNTSPRLGLDFVQQAIVARRSTQTGALVAGPANVTMADDRPALCSDFGFQRNGRAVMAVNHEAISGFSIARLQF